MYWGWSTQKWALRESIPRLFDVGWSTMTTRCAPTCSQALPVKPQGVWARGIEAWAGSRDLWNLEFRRWGSSGPSSLMGSTLTVSVGGLYGWWIHYGTPQSWSTLGNAQQNCYCSLANDWLSSLPTFAGKPLIGLTSNLVDEVIMGLPSPDFWSCSAEFQLPPGLLTHWGRVTHICICKLNIIGSDNGFSPGQCQAINWTNAGILLIGPLRTNFNEILIEIHIFSFKKIRLKMASGKWRPFCFGLSVLSCWAVSVNLQTNYRLDLHKTMDSLGLA